MRRGSAIPAANLEARVQGQAKQISKLRRLVAAYDADLWNEISERLDIRLRHIEREREDNFLKMGEVDLKVAIAREIEIKELRDLPKTAQALLSQLSQENASARERLRQMKKRPMRGG